jgi:ATPase subunit of ABC transporter with duplicated ATPase domains
VLGINGAGRARCCASWPAKSSSLSARPSRPAAPRWAFCRTAARPEENRAGNVEEAVAETRALLHRYDEVNGKLGEDLSPDEMEKVLDEQSKIQDAIDHANAWDLDSRLELAMDALRLPPADADVATLSGGERRRVALCRLLLQSPDLLLLDEPTNHLDAESVAWLERFLKEYPGTVVAVTHDRYFLDNVAGWILELDRGHGIPWEGNYSSWLDQKQERLKLEEKAESTRQQTLNRELEWIQLRCARRPRARRVSTPTKSCCGKRPREAGHCGNLHSAGSLVWETRRRSSRFAGYGDNVADGRPDPSRSSRRCIVGVMIQRRGQDDAVPHDHGIGAASRHARLGETVQIGYVDQSRDALDANKTCGRRSRAGRTRLSLGKKKVPSRAYVSWFNFKGAGSSGRWGVVRRGAQPRSPGETAQARQQSPAAGRADQRSGRDTLRRSKRRC